MDIWRQGSIEKVLERVGEFAHAAGGVALVAQLDTLQDDTERAYETRHRVASLLGALPANTLLQNFGEEATAWTVANDARHRAERLRTELADEGYDRGLLNAACLQSHRRDRVTSGRDVLAQNAVMELLLGDGLSAVDLPALLTESAPPGVSMRESRVKKYGLIPVRLTDEDGYKPSGQLREWSGKKEAEHHTKTPEEGPGHYYYIWLDSYTGFMLTYQGKPQMIVGVEADGTDTVMISQLQRLRATVYDPAQLVRDGFAITGHKQASGLVRLDWPRLAVGAVTHLAKRLGKPLVGIRESGKIPSSDSDIPREQAIAVYDDNADRLFFHRGRDNDWYKSVHA